MDEIEGKIAKFDSSVIHINIYPSVLQADIENKPAQKEIFILIIWTLLQNDIPLKHKIMVKHANIHRTSQELRAKISQKGKKTHILHSLRMKKRSPKRGCAATDKTVFMQPGLPTEANAENIGLFCHPDRGRHKRPRRRMAQSPVRDKRGGHRPHRAAAADFCALSGRGPESLWGRSRVKGGFVRRPCANRQGAAAYSGAGRCSR